MHVEDIEELPRDGSRAWLLVQFGADTEEESAGRAREFAKWLTVKKGYAEDRILVMKSAQEGGQSQDIWNIREGGLGSTAFAPGEDNWPGWEDSAVPPSVIGRYVIDLRELMNRHGIKGAMYGHFGCIRCRLSFGLRTAGGIANYRAFLEEAADLVVSYGGSLSGEHGDGQQRAELLEKQYGLLEKQYGPELLEASVRLHRQGGAAGLAGPELANLVTQAPGLRRLAKGVAGVDRRRPLPRFAPMTLQEWFRRRGGTANPSGRPVMLFPGTFNNHFHVDVGVACVEAIEAGRLAGDHAGRARVLRPAAV